MRKLSITASIIFYLEHVTSAEVKVQALEDCLNRLEIRTPLPHLPQREEYSPESVYYTPHQPAAGIPPTINVPPLAQTQRTVQVPFQKQGKLPRKRSRNGSQQGGSQPVHFSHPPNIKYHNPSPQYHNQTMGCQGGQEGRHQ